ncbi:hypothetical protein FLONG3_4512 [Fusarium longipes]|uniref:Uncharacterized protein n=1 Tax=Fusarium longipes TaxID=694270 RepID=A0A395SY30_9HYPO|nr:hypothetical protein FLONG3_4512 [Fusarium longipes]
MTTSSPRRADEPNVPRRGLYQPQPAYEEELQRQRNQQKLKDKILQTAKSLRTALPTEQETENPSAQHSKKRPRFGDLSPYNVDDKDEKYLWEVEVTRLIDSLEKPQESLNPASSQKLSSAINNLGFTWLEKLSDQLLCALSICALDDNLMLRPESQMGMSPNGSIIGRSINKLETRLGDVPDILRKAGLHARTTSRRPNDKDESYETQPGVEAVNDTEAPIYYQLVDYTTETLVRILCGGFGAEDKYWIARIVTVLAKFSTKLKVLSGGIPSFGMEALSRHAGAREDLERYPFPGADNVSDIAFDVILEVEEAHKPQADRTPAPGDRYVATYASDMTAVSNWLFRIMWHIFTDLNTRNTRGREMDEFEVSAAVFATGSESLPTVAYHNRLGHISGSSSKVAVGMSHRIIDLLVTTATVMRRHPAPRLQLRTGRSTLSIRQGKSDPERLYALNSMAEIISVMIILSCIEPCVTEDLARLCNSVRATQILSKIYVATHGCAVYTSLYNNISQIDPLPLRRSRPLSDYAGLTGRTRTSSELRDRHNAQWQCNFDAIKELDQCTSGATRRRVSASARNWAVEEHAISVSCLPYTITIMSGCAILVLGGLMAGLFVGSRIDGVDPFNLTMFAWIIAGFIILVSKSVRVAEWTWRDFLKGRVTCRTVRELATVTKLSEQDIILHLLSSEKEIPLVLRGPYNNVFSNKGAEGFSVDVKPNVGTLFASGLIVLEVLLESGSALVCLDLRPQLTTLDGDNSNELTRPNIGSTGPSKQRIVHRQREPYRVLACKNPPLLGESEKDVVFRQQLLSWEKIIGIYNKPEQKVR